MNAGLVKRIETGVERSASALFGVAVGYAAYGISVAGGMDPQVAIGAGGAGALAYLPCSRLLRVVGARRAGFAVSDFQVRDAEFAEPTNELLLDEQVLPQELLLTDRAHPDELLLTDSDRVDGDAPLVLDDILDEIGPDARVVSLFDRRAMPAPRPTPGQLQTRIAEHMKDGTPPAAPSDLAGPSDASQALSAALAELRRSLR